MGFNDGGPRHGHRTPAELAEDDSIQALRGERYDVPQLPNEREARRKSRRGDARRLVPVRWVDRAFVKIRTKPAS